MPLEKYTNKGLLEDLNPYLNDSQELLPGALLDENYQKSEAKFEIPVLKAVFEETLATSKATQQQKDGFRNMVNGISKTANYDGTLMGMIEEEAQKFLNGGCSAEDAAKAIQSRAGIYLSEGR